MQHEAFGRRLRQRREELNLSQAELARRLEIDRSLVSNWERGNNLPVNTSFPKLARALATSTDYLFGLAIEREGSSPTPAEPDRPVIGAIQDSTRALRRLLSLLEEEADPTPARSESVPGRVVPVHGPVSAGRPHEALNQPGERMTIPENWLPRREKGFVLRVSGDSMAPYLEHGDLAVVREQTEAKPGDIVVASVHGEPLVKRFLKGKDGYVLRAENVSIADIPVRDGVEISGKVIGFMRHLKRHSGM